MSKELTNKELEAIRYIRNEIVRGHSPSVRDLRKALGYSSPNSANLILKSLIQNKILERRPDSRLRFLQDLETRDDHARTIDIPLVGTAPCGAPLLAEQNIEAMIPVSLKLIKRFHQYFLLRAIGDSMNKAGINTGDLVLIRQQSDANNGDRVVALIDDEATIKELRKNNEAVVLMPRSSNAKHQPIILTQDFQIQGVVVSVVPAVF
jgi:repressor LexA